VALVLALTAALPVGLYQGYQALMRSAYFVVTAIHIDGNERLSRDDILELAGLSGQRNIFALDTDVMRRRLMADAWIIEAHVDLELPRTVSIEVTERESAGWLYSGRLFQVDTDGLIIQEGQASEIDGPLITGIEPVWPGDLATAAGDESRTVQLDRVRTALDIAHWYRSQGLPRFDDLTEIHFDELVGFSLLTAEHGMEVRLGHDRFLERLERLRDVLRTLENRELGGRYVLLDAEGSLTRIAVGPGRPGRGGTGSAGGRSPVQR
jgi:cell division septal protein FtsQ